MTIRYKLLIADSSPERLAAMQESFIQRDYDCVAARTVGQTLSLCSSHCPDMILADIVLCSDLTAFVDGIRRITQCPLLILTGPCPEELRVAAYDAGADDLIARTVSDEELYARCRRALRRWIGYGLAAPSAYEGVYSTGDLTLDFKLRRAFVKGADAGLTQREWRLVSLLACHAGQVLEYDDIIQRLWGMTMPDGNQILRVNLANIRRKLGEQPRSPKYIFTHAGVGYSMPLPDGADSPNSKAQAPN